MSRKFVLFFFSLFCLLAAPAIAQNSQTIIAPSAFKSPEVKTEFDNHIKSFGDLINEIPTSFIYSNSSRVLVKNCADYERSANRRHFPLWANESVSKFCNWGQTMDALLDKNKKPIGMNHCRNLGDVIKLIEANSNTQVYLETSASFARLLASLKKAYNARSTHSWTGGWYGPNSYDYRCN